MNGSAHWSTGCSDQTGEIQSGLWNQLNDSSEVGTAIESKYESIRNKGSSWYQRQDEKDG